MAGTLVFSVFPAEQGRQLAVAQGGGLGAEPVDVGPDVLDYPGVQVDGAAEARGW